MDTSKNLSGYLVTEQIHRDDRTLIYRGVREEDSVPVVIKILSHEYPSLSEDALDFPAIIQAAQSLSREIQLDELLKKLTQILLQNSGVEKCILVLSQEGVWQVRAISTLEATELCSVPLEEHPDIPIELIQYVKQTRSVVVVNNLETDLPVIGDYLRQRQPRSILGLPIISQGQLAGILYLKHRTIAGIFTKDRLTAIDFLCTQAAISLENARLYQQSQSYAQKLEESLGKLQANEIRFHNLANNIPGMVYQFRLDLNGLPSTPYVSSGCRDLYGLAPESVMAGTHSLYAMHHPDDNPRIAQAIAKSAQNLTPFNEEWRIILPSGKMKWIQSAARPERQADGAVLWDGVVIDITDRKQAEEENSRFLLILEAIPDMVGSADVQGNNIYLNPAGQKLLEIPAAQMNQFHISETVPSKEIPKMQQEMLPTAMREGIWAGESIMHSRSGEDIPVAQVIMAHKNAGGEVEFLSTIARDIRDRKLIEAERLQKSQALEQALANLQETQLQMIQSEKMSALGNLVAGVAHEINNPVGFIAGNLNEAQKAVQDLVEHLNLYRDRVTEAEIADHAEEIDLDYILEDLPQMINSMKIGCDRIKAISTSLRTFSRADQNHAVQVNLHEGIDSTIMILKHRLKANEFYPEIQVIREYGDLPKVECYAGQLNQVFMNILANAIDALEESNQGRNYPEIHNQITIRTEVSLDRRVIIRIQDNGKGMSAEVKQKIFEHLFTTKGMGKGTGLGLAIAQQIIVEKHQGSIEVNSTLGVGTEFIITLPIS